VCDYGKTAAFFYKFKPVKTHKTCPAKKVESKNNFENKNKFLSYFNKNSFGLFAIICWLNLTKKCHDWHVFKY
jgi:hypothetical protein